MSHTNRILSVICLLMSLSVFLAAQRKTNPKKETVPAATKTETPKNNLANLISGLSFRSIGPAVTSGRISDFAVVPGKPSTYYVATASGGVWKTTNRGTTWQPLFDGQGSYSIGCITLEPNNPSTVWVGTGENNNQRSVAYGDGVYKSTDGGKTWQNMGLKTSEHIANIVIDPQQPSTIYVAAYGPLWKEGGERGVYKSTDGGKTWSCVKSIDEFTGCNALVMDPRDPKVLYAAFHQRMRKVFTYIGGGPSSGIYKTTDGGITWTKLEGGFPGGELGRIGIDVSPVNPDLIYAVVEAKDGKGGIYRSTDRGASWEKRSGTYTSGNYYQELTCDPHLADKIYITDTYYKVSTDGGKTTGNLGEINKHIDNHAIWIDPKDPNHLLIGCDGGIYETFDHAASYDFKSNLPVTQFYKVSTDNDLPFYGVHGGTQDNLSLGGPSRTTSANGITNADWYVTSLGDGFETQVDPTDANVVYAQSQYGGLVRFDKKSGEYLPIKPVEGENEAALRWNWDAPLLISRHNPRRLYFGANKLFRTDDRGNSWQVISPDLSRKLDRNTMEVMGKVWSVDAIAKNGSTDIFGQTTSIAESALDEQILWVGTDDGLIQLTTDGGKSWKQIDNLPGVPPMSYVHQIIASQHDRLTAYVCFNHHRYGDFTPYLLKTSDGGSTWKSITGNLPERGSVYTIAEDHIQKDLLFTGTEFGCYVTLDGGKQWTALSSGLPVIAVRDMEIQRRENDLVLATFGRGFYILDDYSPLRSLTQENTDREAMICPVKDALLYIPRYPLGLRDKGHLGSSYFSTPNPEVGAVVTWYAREGLKKKKEMRKEKEKEAVDRKEVVYYPPIDSLRVEDNEADPFYMLTITDRNGNVIRHIKAGSGKGLHRMTWDLRYAPPDPVAGRYYPGPDQLFGSAPQGHLVAPGTYKVLLYACQNGNVRPLTEAVSFEVRWLNQSSTPSADLSENVSFLQNVTDVSRRLNALTDLVSTLEEKTRNAELAILDMPAPASGLLSEAHAIRQALIPVRTALLGDAARASREFETSPSISDRIGNAAYSVWNSTSAIPAIHTASFEIGAKQMEGFIPVVSKLRERMEALERTLDEMKAPYTPGRWPDRK